MDSNTNTEAQPALRQPRRRFLKLAGLTAATTGLAGCGSNNSGESTNNSTTGSGETQQHWNVAKSPTEKTLYAVVMSENGPYAVGGSGLVLTRRSDGWKIVAEQSQNYALLDAGVTDDGRHVWFAGSSGAVGQYDVTDAQLTDYSAPKGKTSTWTTIAVAGYTGNEHVYLANGSGEVLSGHNTAEDGMSWGKVVKPGGGSTLKGSVFLAPSIGYLCDTNAKVYETTTGGDRWQTIGIEGGSVGLYDIAAVDQETINTVGGDGSIFRYNGSVWTKLAASSNTLYAIVRNDSDGFAVGGSGTILKRTSQQWQQEKTPTSNTLRGIVIGTDSSDVAVGSSGTILETRSNGSTTTVQSPSTPTP